MKALIDADVLVYEIGFGCETGWQGDESPPWNYVAKLFDLRVANINALVGATEPPLLFLSGPKNFRNDLAVTKVYKGTRRDHKPYHYSNITAYIKGMWEHVVSDGIEADDLMCIYQTIEENKRPPVSSGIDYHPNATIICSRDKDLRQCPGWHFSWELGKQPQFGPEFVDIQGWIKLDRTGSSPKIVGTGLSFFYAQLLTGDVVDNIPGLPGCGAVKAFKILDKCDSHEDMLSTIIQEYQNVYKAFKNGWTNRLIEQGRLLWMVRRLNNDGSPVMWNIGDTA